MKKYEAKAKKHDALKLTRQKQGKKRESRYHGEVAKGIRKKKRNLRHKEKKSLFAKLFPVGKSKKRAKKRKTRITRNEKKQAIAMAKQINEAFHPKPVVYGIPGAKNERGEPQFAPIGKRAANGKRKTIYVMTNGDDGKSSSYREVKVAYDFGDGYVVSHATRGKGYVVTNVSTGKQISGIFNFTSIKDAKEFHEGETFKQRASNVDKFMKDKAFLDKMQSQMNEASKTKIALPEEPKKPKPPKKDPDYWIKKGLVIYNHPEVKTPLGKTTRNGTLKTYYSFERSNDGSKRNEGDEFDFVERKVLKDLGVGLVIAKSRKGKGYDLIHVNTGTPAIVSAKSINEIEEKLNDKEWVNRLNNAVKNFSRPIISRYYNANNHVKPMKDE